MYKTPEQMNQDITHMFFKHPSECELPEPIDSNINYNNTHQYLPYSQLDYQNVIPVVKKFFEPSADINEIMKHFENKYSIDTTKCIAVYYRGTDKINETKLDSFHSYYAQLTELLSHPDNHGCKILLQSDSAQFFDYMKDKFHGSPHSANLFAIEEIVPTRSTTNGAHCERTGQINHCDIKHLLAVVLTISKCKHVICSSCNVAQWIMFYRGNSTNVHQSLNLEWLEHPNHIILCNECCILDETRLYIFGIYNIEIYDIKCVNSNNHYVHVEVLKCTNRPDICVAINKNAIIGNTMTFIVNNNIIMKDIVLETPFENQLPFLNNKHSNIISTMCKNYNHRLDEWIMYNIKLGFDAIVIFDNSENKTTPLNESDEFVQDINCVTDKYKGKVLVIKCPYAPFKNEHWNNIQRLTLHIGATAFKNKVRYISFIDADEFIYIPRTNNNISHFLEPYDETIQFGSNILTNKKNDDVINNNILSTCRYVGPDKYTKIFLRTSKCMTCNGGTNDVVFVISPHERETQLKLHKNVIIHYHCWVNDRCVYNSSFPIMNHLCEFMQRS
jgi:hypothetical protein